MNKPLVSIVILSALRKQCTQRCIESIDKFTPIPHEVIIVDMGKDKSIREWLNKEKNNHNNFKIILNSNNVGTSKGRNQGIKLAEGEYIVFLDNDAIVTEGWIESLLETSKRYRDGALFGSKIICPNNYTYFCNRYVYECSDNSIREIGVRVVEPFVSDDPKINIEKEVPWYPTGSLMARRSFLEEANGFDENLFFVEEDKDLCCRAKEKGYEIIYCPSSSIIHDRIKDDTYDRSIRYNNIGRIKQDITYFELRWGYSVGLIYSKECLKLVGYSEAMINEMLNGELKELFTVV